MSEDKDHGRALDEGNEHNICMSMTSRSRAAASPITVGERAKAGQTDKICRRKYFQLTMTMMYSYSDMTPAECGPMRALRTV